MTTIKDVIGNYTPLSNNVVKKLKLVRGAVACKIFFTSNLKDRICRMGLTRIAGELGIDKSTASKSINWLEQQGYINKIQKATPISPAHYQCTQKFYDLAEGVDLINPPVDVVNSPVDLINQKEDIKEEVKEVLEPNDHLFAELVALLKMPKELMTPKMQRAYEDFIMDLQEMGAQAGDITRFSQWWYKNDWRGKQKQKPTLQQVRDSWGDFVQPQQNGKVIKNTDGSYYL